MWALGLLAWLLSQWLSSFPAFFGPWSPDHGLRCQDSKCAFAATPERTLHKISAAVSSVVRVRAWSVLRPWGRSHGSGFVVDNQGRIATNYHVVQHAELFAVEFADGVQRRAKILGVSPDCDLAVLELVPISNSTWRPPAALELAAEAPPVGEQLAAIGHPGHWASLVGEGSVLAVGRRSSRLVKKLGSRGALKRFQRRCAADGMLMTSTTAGPGSSGGPLMAPDGLVAGVITWQFSGGSIYPTVMVAIRPEVLQRVLPALLQGRYFEAATSGLEGRLGPARLELPRPRQNALLGLQWDGVRVLGEPGPPAQGAGLRRFDELLEVDGFPVRQPADALEAVQKAGLAASSLWRSMTVEVAFRRLGDPPGTVRRGAIVISPQKPNKVRAAVGEVADEALQVYLLFRVIKVADKVRRELQGDLKGLWRGGLVLSKWLQVRNASTSEQRAVAGRLARLALQFVWDTPANICSPWAKAKTCNRVPDGPSPTVWNGVTNASACRSKCESHTVDAELSCCSYTPEGHMCEHLAVKGHDKALQDTGPSTFAALCQSIHPERAMQRSLALLSLFWRVLSNE